MAAEPAMLEVALLNGEVLGTFEITTDCPVAAVKQIIASREGTPTWMQRLSLGSKELLDRQTLQSYGLSAGQRICITLCRTAKFLPLEAFKEAPLSSNLCLQAGKFEFRQGQQG